MAKVKEEEEREATMALLVASAEAAAGKYIYLPGQTNALPTSMIRCTFLCPSPRNRADA